MLRWSRVFVFALLATLSGALPAAAQSVYDTPSVQVVRTAPSYVAVDITAGPSGAPAGFMIEWMKKSDYDNYGWEEGYSYGLAYCLFDGAPTLNMTGSSDYVLGPNESVRVVLGQLFDETGVTTNYLDEIPEATEYVLRIYAEGDLNGLQSAYSSNVQALTTDGNDCTYTVGYWKTHGEGDCHDGNNIDAWVPVTQLTLGTVVYTKAQLCDILNTPAAGNGLISLAHQLIAAKLNIAHGANPATIQATINAADALINGLVIPPIGGGYLAPATTSPYTSQLDDYNNGLLGPTHCDEVSARPATWGRLKSLYR